ncbi:CPBP family intramembrane glutamic endopeptidase [Winogradskyella sp.]|uniref:CPBP family intramembrane glutamic endopeptidase n=1 Tax=Winogradskyella sp. TaxID=1883156 RepID=UPI003BACC531
MTTINLYLLAALIVGVIFPTYAIWNGKKTKQLIIANPEMKIAIFKQTGIILIVLTILSITPFLVYHESLEVLGLTFMSKPYWVLALFFIALLGLFVLRKIRLSKNSATKFYEANSAIHFLLPATKNELNVTIIVSFIAGFCEEIVYRGFLFWYLSQHLHIAIAMILANLPFALGHLTTTGTKNTFAAFILAFVFSTAYVLTQSLWLPILLHILVDLYSMVFAYRAHQIINHHN